MEWILYVAPDGDDRNPGTLEAPFATWTRAKQEVSESKPAGPGPVVVHFRGGLYELAEPVVFAEADSGSEQCPIVYRAFNGEEVIISGGMTLKLDWAAYRDGIMKAEVPESFATDQLFVNGMPLHMARYPNYNPDEPVLNGHAADCIDPERVRRWSRPEGGFIHTLHKHGWGGFHYRITGKDREDRLLYEGGWQNNRQLGMSERYRFVENIIEELDAPGEWYLDTASRTLYVYPPVGVDLNRSHVESVCLRHLVELQGNPGRAVRHIHIEGMTFRRTSRTFMDTREPLLRSDWTMYRGGAILFNGAEQCTLVRCFVDHPGGNAVVVNGYNRNIAVKECRIEEAGGSGVAFVGEASAVRSPLFEYAERQSYPDLDLTPGPRTADYPADCLVEDCLISHTGRVEKQSAGVHISMSQDITIRHCTIYDMPRAGINISEGTWGGHLIEFCDVFDTVKETSDHGAFNSWGRDRYWGLKDIDLNELNKTPGDRSELPLLDAVKPTILRNNRWRTERGWDIDLDDGSSHYQIVNNLCLHGGIKLREGFYRVCENNITVNNTLHPHVWYRGSRDILRSNIVFEPYKPIRVQQPWGDLCDSNLLHAEGRGNAETAAQLQELSGSDPHSLAGDARFINPEQGDYRVESDSPALRLGFVNFPMDRFGTRSPALRVLARSPQLPQQETLQNSTGAERDGSLWKWKGATLKNVVGLGEVSAYGLPEEAGVIVLEVLPGSAAAVSRLKERDVIVEIAGTKVDTLHDLREWSGSVPCKLGIIRNQEHAEVTLT